MELLAELRGRDGQTRSVRVPCPAVEGEIGQLRALRQGLEELQQRVVEMLAPLVQEEREAAGGGGGGPRSDMEDEDEEGGDEDEDENNIDTTASADDPPPKRTRVQQP